MDKEKDEQLMDALHEHMRKERAREQKEEYAAWCNTHAQLPTDYAPQLRPGLVADIELAPMRWMRLGLELIESAKGTTPIQLFDGVAGPPMQTYLPYPVFQAGTEVFLKGMWLAQNAECRVVESGDYVAIDVRKRYQVLLRKLGHDLLQIVEELEKVLLYREEGNIARFLKVISGVTRRFYYPLTEDDAAWANARYPRRFYDDAKAEAHADQLKSYPEQWPLVLLFRDTMPRVDRLWGITEGLARRAKKGEL
jgi:hypothetical protein